jgi:hypothetical protein
LLESIKWLTAEADGGDVAVKVENPIRVAMIDTFIPNNNDWWFEMCIWEPRVLGLEGAIYTWTNYVIWVHSSVYSELPLGY